MVRALVVRVLIVGVGAGAGVAVGLASGVAAAKGSPGAACVLLSAADITDVTGSKAGEGHKNDTTIASGPQKGTVLAGCMWKLGEQGMVNVNVFPAATGAAREAGLARIRQATEKLRSQGWKEDKQSFGAVVCATLTPPPSQTRMPVSAGCMGEAKGMALSVGAMSPGATVPIPKLKALYDKAVSRLP